MAACGSESDCSDHDSMSFEETDVGGLIPIHETESLKRKAVDVEFKLQMDMNIFALERHIRAGSWALCNRVTHDRKPINVPVPVKIYIT